MHNPVAIVPSIPGIWGSSSILVITHIIRSNYITGICMLSCALRFLFFWKVRKFFKNNFFSALALQVLWKSFDLSGGSRGFGIVLANSVGIKSVSILTLSSIHCVCLCMFLCFHLLKSICYLRLPCQFALRLLMCWHTLKY